MRLPILSLALAHALCFGAAQAQVVADSACEKNAVDIAAFATCDSPTRVARADADEDAAVAPRVDNRKARNRPSEEQDEAETQAPGPPSVRKR